MSYQISDLDEFQIFITDGWRDFYVPKFRIHMVVDEPICYLYWTDTEKGHTGYTRMLPLDYTDVAFGYTTPSTASEVRLVIEAYQISAWTNITPAPTTIFDIVNVTGDDTLALTDAWKALVIDDSGGTVTITVPDNTAVAFDIGTEIRLLAATTESVDIIPDTGVTINSLNGWLSLEDQFAEATLIKTGTDEWYLVGNLRRTMDSDAAALVAAIGTLTDAEIIAIDDWFVAAKTNGYYTKLKVVTGHCLGSASNNKWNWLNPVDSNAAFRAVYYGSPTVNARSMTFNGTSQYFRNLWDTAVNIFSTPYSTSVIQCFRSNTASNGASFGFVNGSHIWSILPKYGGTLFSDCYDQAANRMSVANADATGIYVQTRTSSTVHKVFKDGTQIGGTDTDAATNWANLTAEPYWMCWNNGGAAVYFNGEPWLTACGDGLSDSEAAFLTTDLQTLKTALGI